MRNGSICIFVAESDIVCGLIAWRNGIACSYKLYGVGWIMQSLVIVSSIVIQALLSSTNPEVQSVFGLDRNQVRK